MINGHITKALLAAALCVACLVTARQPVRAYSSFNDYTRPIEEGGGGGPLFTGSPADAYGCEVCHRGGEQAKLEVTGLPADGYVPGQTYAITLRWPATTHVALMAEFTDTAGLPSGVTALAPYATWLEGEFCENGFPAADVCRPGGATSGCCRDVDPMRDACSFPGERSVFWMLDCRSKFARVLWTAPPAAAGDVWFSSDMVNSNLQNDALGDGVTLVRQRLRPSGASKEVTSAVGACQAVAGTRLRSPWLAFVVIAPLVLARRITARSRRSMTTCWLLGALYGACWLSTGCSRKHTAPSQSSSKAAERDAAAARDAGDVEDARRPGEHYIVTRDCKERRYGQGFDVKPSTQCPAGNQCYGVQCLGPEDCKDKPFARCLSSGEGKCVYGAVAGGEACVADRECTRLPGGHCAGTVSYSVCQYNNRCATDADCAPQHRCDCGSSGDLFCAFLGCTRDSDCESGERCLRTNPCGFGPFGDYRCTTPQDECEPDSDTTCGYCDFDTEKAHWLCKNFICD